MCHWHAPCGAPVTTLNVRKNCPKRGDGKWEAPWGDDVPVLGCCDLVLWECRGEALRHHGQRIVSHAKADSSRAVQVLPGIASCSL
eukprot:263946-Rhodomonas_salina.1